MPIARAIVDVNRAPEDRPPKNQDGVVKTVTINGTPVYKGDKFPDDALIEELLQRYYYPYLTSSLWTKGNPLDSNRD